VRREVSRVTSAVRWRGKVWYQVDFGEELTLLRNQRLSTGWQTDHDHTDLGILDADANAIYLAGAGHLHGGDGGGEEEEAETEEEEENGKRRDERREWMMGRG
jgi:hypothetical protein